MSQTAPSCLPIDETALAPHKEGANALIDSVSWTIKKDPYAITAASTAAGFRNDLVGNVAAREDKVSLLMTALRRANGAVLLPESVNHCLQTVWQSLRIGQHLTDLYVKASNLDQLQRLNEKRQLTPDAQTEFREKNETAAAILLFTTAAYISFDLGQYRRETVETRKLDLPPIPEFVLGQYIMAKRCFVYYLTACLDRSGLVNDDVDFQLVILRYAQATMDEIKSRAGSLRHTAAFMDKRYKLDKTEFIVSGFEPPIGESRPQIEFNRVRAIDIVGNADAKHLARRLVERILCYDLARKANPMRDLGGLPILRAGYGVPGTGKGMHISFVATMLAERCQTLTGLPFFYNPMPLNLVSTYQGGSAERTIDWLAPFKNPGHICYGPIDDAEQNFQERTRQGVSAGVHEIINTFLPTVEGANAIWYGNAVMELFTNLMEIIDKAVLSRVQMKFTIDGAKTWEDFLDQNHNWWKKYKQMDPAFVSDLKDPESYVYLTAQKFVSSIAQTSAYRDEPSHPILRAVFAEAEKRYRPDNHGFFAQVCYLVKQRVAGFSSRDLRNIQRAVDERFLDFDFPEDWMDEPDRFYRKDYDEKKGMIIEAMKTNMRGLSFRQVQTQELIRYLETWFQIQETGMERAVEEAAKRWEIDLLGRDRAAKKMTKEKP